MTHAFPSCVYSSRYRLPTEEVTSLLDTALAGRPIDDRGSRQRLVATIGAAQTLLDLHRIDGRGRCGICSRRPARWWPWRSGRRTCSVFDTFGTYLTRPADLAHDDHRDDLLVALRRAAQAPD